MKKKSGSDTVSVKWSLDTIDRCKKLLTNEQLGELFFAVMHYAATGEKMPFPMRIS